MSTHLRHHIRLCTRHATALAAGGVAVLLCHAATVGAATSRAPRAAAAATRAPAAAPARGDGGRWNLADSPGWYPAFDAESSAVAIGRRLNAPFVRAPFRGGARSIDDLGRMICRQLHHRNADSLLALCVADSEFRDVLWREFPQSRPATGLTWEDGWTPLQQRLISGCASAVEDEGGRALEYQSIRADSVAHYRNFTLYQRVTLTAKDDTGGIRRMRWLRAIAERRGRYKIYSTTD